MFFSKDIYPLGSDHVNQTMQFMKHILINVIESSNKFGSHTQEKKNEGPPTVRNKVCLNRFMKVSLRFWSLYRYLNYLYSGQYRDLLYNDR